MTESTTAVEQILVVPTALFHEVGHFNGFCSDTNRYLPVILDPAYGSYRPRPEMERDPAYKQLIPYCIFRYGDAVFCYQRGNSQGESRLHAKWSVGVGGHISTLDVNRQNSPYQEGMQRELDEEVSVDSRWTESCIGLINDDETDVGRVHLGVVHVFDVDQPKVAPREQSMVNAGFVSSAELVRRIDEFETWSQICLKHLFS